MQEVPGLILASYSHSFFLDGKQFLKLVKKFPSVAKMVSTVLKIGEKNTNS